MIAEKLNQAPQQENVYWKTRSFARLIARFIFL